MSVHLFFPLSLQRLPYEWGCYAYFINFAIFSAFMAMLHIRNQ
jgi:hypothetical protein